MPRPLRIGYINNHYQLGGVEAVVRQLHSGMTRRGHRSRLFVGMGKDYPWNAGVTPLYPRVLSWLDHSRWREQVGRLAPRRAWTDRNFRKLAEAPVDVFHVHSFHDNYASIESLAYLAARKPVCWTLHGHWAITGGCEHPKGCERFLSECGDCPLVGEWPMNGVDDTAMQLQRKRERLAGMPVSIVATSGHSEALIRRSRIGRDWPVRRITNGIRVDPAPVSWERKRDAAFRRSLGLRPEAKVILVVNRHYPMASKGFPMVREALHRISPEGVQVILVGGHSDWARRQLPPELDCLDAGYAANDVLARYYEAADFFLFASEAENFPCVILEAMAAQCCVVSTPTQGVTEQIEPGRDGWLAEALSGEALGDLLRRALAEEGKSRALAEAGRERALRDFSEEVMLDRYEALYRELAGRA